jgi:hypothetical protein
MELAGSIWFIAEFSWTGQNWELIYQDLPTAESNKAAQSIASTKEL